MQHRDRHLGDVRRAVDEPGLGRVQPARDAAPVPARHRGAAPALYAVFYDSVAAHARHGLNVVADVGHHDAYSAPLHLLRDAGRRLRGLSALLVGVRCRVEEIMRRRDPRRLAGPPPTALDQLATNPAPR